MRCLVDCVVPPLPPQIEGYQNGSTIKVSHKLTSLDIVCVSLGGKPAATLTWQRNGVAISDNILYSTEPAGSASKLLDARSVLSINPRDADNEAIYSCHAVNTALQNPLSTSIQLNVLR